MDTSSGLIPHVAFQGVPRRGAPLLSRGRGARGVPLSAPGPGARFSMTHSAFFPPQGGAWEVLRSGSTRISPEAFCVFRRARRLQRPSCAWSRRTMTPCSAASRRQRLGLGPRPPPRPSARLLSPVQGGLPAWRGATPFGGHPGGSCGRRLAHPAPGPLTRGRSRVSTDLGASLPASAPQLPLRLAGRPKLCVPIGGLPCQSRALGWAPLTRRGPARGGVRRRRLREEFRGERRGALRGWRSWEVPARARPGRRRLCGSHPAVAPPTSRAAFCLAPSSVGPPCGAGWLRDGAAERRPAARGSRCSRSGASLPGPPRPRAPRRLLTRPACPSARSAAEVRRRRWRRLAPRLRDAGRGPLPWEGGPGGGPGRRGSGWARLPGTDEGGEKGMPSRGQQRASGWRPAAFGVPRPWAASAGRARGSPGSVRASPGLVMSGSRPFLSPLHPYCGWHRGSGWQCAAVPDDDDLRGTWLGTEKARRGSGAAEGARAEGARWAGRGLVGGWPARGGLLWSGGRHSRITRAAILGG